MKVANKPNEALRYQRLLRGWSLQRVADELCCIGVSQNGKRPGVNGDMIGEWERGVKNPSPYYREKLCLLYGMNASQLHLMVPPPGQICVVSELQVLSQHREGLVNDMELNRRELLRLMAVAGAALILPLPLGELDWDRVDNAVTRPSRVDQRVLTSLEGINANLWGLYLAAPAKSQVLDGVLGQLKMLVQFLTETHPLSVHKQLLRLASEVSQLAGEIYFDRHETDTADSCYVFAATSAKEAGAFDLWSCALVRRSFLPIYAQKPQYQDALPLLSAAYRLALQGDASLSTKYWSAAVEAEAQSGVKQLRDCQMALERARGVEDVKQSGPAWTRFDASRLPALEGACFTRLEQPTLARPALENALVQFTKPGRKRGMVLLDLATASLQEKDVDHSCGYLTEVVDIVELGASGFLRDGVRKLRQQLTPFADSVVVQNLDRHMQVLV